MPQVEQILNTKLQEFNTKYNLHITAEDFNIRGVDKNPQGVKQNYQDMLISALLEYVSNTMKMRDNASYDFSQISYADFAQDFEGVMQAKCDVQRIGGRPAYEGIKLDVLFDAMMEETRKYSYPLATLWKNDFISGAISVESMRAITNNATNTLLGPEAEDPNNMTEKSKNALTCLLASKQAMEAVRESRTFGWAFFHPILNYREKKYLKTLRNTVKTCEQQNFPTEEVVNVLNTETLQETFENLQNHEVYEYKYADVKKANDNYRKNLLKNGVVHGLIDHYLPKQTSQEYQEKLAQDLINVLPEGGVDTSVKTKQIQAQTKSLMQKANDLNMDYQEKVNMENAHSKTQSYTEDIFIQAFKMTEGFKYNLKGRLLAAQRMTDIIMKELSPAPLAQEALGKYADGYILENHNKMFEERICYSAGLSTKDIKDVNLAMQEAYGAYQSIKNGREPIIFEPGTFNEVTQAIQSSESVYQLKDANMRPEDLFSVNPFGDAGDVLKDFKKSEAELRDQEREKESLNIFTK